MNKLLYPEIASLAKPAKKLVVLLHGLGSNGDDLIKLVPFIQDALPDSHFIAPHGIEPYDQAPYGKQWFSFQDRTPYVLQRLLEHNAAALMDIILKKQAALQLTNKDTIIIGFSQGTMMGLYVALVQEQPFLAAIGFSGLLIAPSSCINSATPICLIHGELDQVISIEAMDDAMQYLLTCGISYKGYRVPGLAHSIDSRGLKYAVDFINNLKLV